MSAESNSDIQIFTEALRLPPEARADYIDRTCAGDENMRRNVQALLSANDRAGRFLEELPSAFAGERIQQIGAIEKPGDRIGRYQLLKQIGEGGWGVVFLAEQTEPVRRQVALKVIKPGMDTRSVIARFEAERQALALMNYPHIARVLDAGATQTGRPFFVMELVSGIKITDYCDEKPLATRERLELFIKVCGAIQYAHQKGIIHRDVKPSNILVDTAPDGTAFPMVIDFGVIKATTNQPLLHNTSLTANEALIGTPAYMSPEQAAHLDIDTRADIYSLGVLLYELLTGTTPFDSRTLAGKGLDEIRRVISTEDPLRPSTRLKAMSLADLRSLSQRRQADSAKLMREVRGDLDWIVTKALEKDRARRYATANALAMDVQRYLAGEPILARPPSTIYRVQKLMRRNKLAFAACAAIAAMLFLGIAASLWQAHRAVAEQQATAKAAVQRTAREDSESIFFAEAIKQQEEMLTLSRKVNGPEHPATLDAMNSLARSYFAAGRKPEAIKLQEELLALSRKVRGSEHLDTLVAMEKLAIAYFSVVRMDEAIHLQEEALTLSRKVRGSEQLDTLTATANLATFYSAAGRKNEAIKLREEALALSLRQGPNSPERAAAYAALGFSLDAVGRGEEAIKAWQEAVRISPSGTQNAAYWLGKALVDRQRYAEALPILRATRKFYPDGDRGRETAERVALAEVMVGQDKAGASDRALTALQVSVADNPADTDKAKQLATVYLWLGQTNEHLAVCRKLLDLVENSTDPSFHDRAAKAYLIQAQPDPQTMKQAVASARQALKLAATNDSNRAWFLVTAAMAAVRDGRPAEADSILDDALKVGGADLNRRSLALAYRTLEQAHQGRTKEARASLAELDKLLPAFPAPGAPSAILLQPDFLAVCLAHEEAKALLNLPPPPSNP